ncbi:hypothetical protein PENTCL1PPCAC_11362 [Pristionchus entomophagus]|uniref:CBS domain-containing protein n=1 Tax=Pristionchus entomophagus TaxID=358040 RepID=A0AAV5T0T0_9BILA|nr:hypothetical protein PENTCL1PPCAC_11362 [Pristionchus entomophagus]
MMTISSATAAPPRVSSPARTSPGPSGKKEKEKKGLLSTAKAKATGSLRKALYGKSKKKAKDAEDIAEEDEDDYSSSNYDTVRSLPASGHYGNRRRPEPLRVSIEEVDHSSSSSPPPPPPPSSRPRSSAGSSPLPPSAPLPLTSTVVIRLPRRRVGGGGGGGMSLLPALSRLSPLGVTSCGRLSRSVPAAPTDPDPAFDFAAWHSNLDLINNQDSIYSLFMKAHKCYDLIPLSTKLVVFDTHLPVRKAFFALVYNGVRAAPLWDSDRQTFVGMLTITDFIKILYRHHSAGDDAEKMAALEEQQIEAWRDKFKEDESLRPLVSIDPNESLYRAVELLCESHVHRLPVMEKGTGNISYILTHKRIIKFLSLYMHDLPKPAFMDDTPKSLGIGSWGDVLTIHVDTPLIDALKIFLENRVSALPLVDEDGKAVDIYAKFDVISLAADKAYDKLDITVHEALKHRQEWFEGVRTCKETDSLFSVLESIVKAEVHRLIVTDENDKVTGIISLSDILKYLVLDRCAPVSSTSLTMERVDEQMNDCSPSPLPTSEMIVDTPPVFQLLEEQIS